MGGEELLLTEEVPRSGRFALVAVVVAVVAAVVVRGGKVAANAGGGRKVLVDAGGGTKVAVVEFVATALMMSSVG